MAPQVASPSKRQQSSRSSRILLFGGFIIAVLATLLMFR